MSHPLETPSRQQKFLTAYRQTGDKEYAAQEAWPELPPRRRKTIAAHVLTEPRVHQYLKDAGLGVTKVFKTVAKGLEAKKLVNCNGIFEEVDNTEAQLKAAEMACRLHGLLTNKERPQETNVNVSIDPTRLAAVADRLQKINDKMIQSRNTTPATDAEIIL